MGAVAEPGRRRAVLVFDGDCGFCTSAVNLLKAALPALPSFVPYQWAELESLGLTEEEAAERVWLVDLDERGEGRQYGGHLAVSVLLRRQPSPPWRFLGFLLDTPPFSILAAAGYALVARYRHLLPGGTPACRLEPRP